MKTLALINEAEKQEFNTLMDIDISSEGRLVFIEGKDKLRQQLRKVVLTANTVGSLEESYGSKIWDFVGGKRDSLFEGKVKSAITFALGQYRQFQKWSGLLLSEKLKTILRIDVKQEGLSDKRQVISDIYVLTESGETIQVSIGS